MSFGGEPDPKRYKVDPDTVKGKNVVVLLETDVPKNGQEMFMPNTIEMAQIKKPEKGRFVTNIKFTSEMTERDVLRVLRQKLDILNYKRSIRCASASDNRTRLNFHGEPRLWSGELIRRHIRGNSALYLLVEGNCESRVVRNDSQVLHVSAGTLSVAAAGPLTASSVSSSSQQNRPLYIQRGQANLLGPAAYSLCGNTQLCGRTFQQTLEQGMVAGKRGNVPQQSVPPSGQQGNGTCYAGADHCNSTIGQQSTLQRRQPEISPTLGATQNSSLQVSSVASQPSVNHVPVTPSVQYQAELNDGTALLGIPSKQSLPISVPQVPAPTQRLQELSQTSTTADQWEITGKRRDSLNALLVEAGKLSDTVNQMKRKSSFPRVPLKNSVFDQIFQIALTERESSDSGVQSMWEESMNSDYDTEAGLLGDIKPVISPCKGSTKGGDQFHLILQDFVPAEVVTCVAIFEGCDEVLLDVVNPFTLSGYTPCSKGPGLVKVKLRSFDGSWKGGETEFLYEDLFTRDELLIQLVNDPEMQRKMFGWMGRGMNNPSNQQTSGPFDEMEQGSSVMNQSRYAMSVKLLHCLVYKAAEIDGQEFIQVIFSTSAGKVVFNSYKNNALLPEDVARANGHTVLAYYLQHVNNRLSKETFDSRTEGIDWFELMRAVDEEQSLSFNDDDDAQMLKIWCSTNCPQSDDNESDYFADDESSSCSSPSDSEVSDSENLEGAEPENVVFEQEQSLVPSSNHTGNHHEWIPCTDIENAVEHIQLFCDEVDLKSSEGSLLESKVTVYEHASDKTEQSDHPVENTVSRGSELGDWKVLESEIVSLKQDQSSVFPVKHTGNQLQFISRSMKENATEYVQLFPDKLDSHNSKDGSNEGGLSEPKIEEYEHAGLKTDQHHPIENTFLTGSEIRLDCNTSKSEVKSTILEVSTGTTNSHNEAIANLSSHQETECIKNTLPCDCKLRGWNTLKSKRRSISFSGNFAEIIRSFNAKLSRQWETDEVMETNDGEDVLDRDKEVFKKIHNDKTTHSRGLTPAAILARGSKAQAAYERALEYSKTRDKRVAVVFIRLKRSRKISLLRSLRGESFNKDKAGTVGIQMDSPLWVGIRPWKPVSQSDEYITVFDHTIAKRVARRLSGGSHELEGSPKKTTTSNVFEECPAEKKGPTNGVEGSGYNVDLEMLHSRTGGIRSPQGSPPSQCREVDESDLLTEPASQVLQDAATLFFKARFNSQARQDEILQNIRDFGQYTKQWAEMSNMYQTNLDNRLRGSYSVPSFPDPSSVEGSGTESHAQKVLGDPWHVMDAIFNTVKGIAFSWLIIGEKFRVDNTCAGQPFRHEDPNVQRPRKKILSVTSTLPHTKREIPLQWLCFEKLIYRLASSDVKHITNTDFKAIANKICHSEEEEDSKEFLHFFCDCGTVLYFNEADHSNSLVILDPEWLINVFCQIITVSSNEEPVQIRAHRRTLAKDGILSQDLINYACQNLDLKLSPDSLLSIMEKYNLICRWVRQNGEVDYLVPSMLPAKPDKEISGLISQGSIAPIYVRFHAGYVSHGLFSRFVVSFGQYTSYELSTRLPMHFSNAARFFLGEKNNYKVTFACFKSVITIHLVHEGKSEDEKETAAMCGQVCRFVEDTLALLSAQCPWLHSMTWQLCARCDLCVGEDEDPDGCSWHHVHCCLHPDCAHFIPLDSRPLRCDKTYKLNSLLIDDKLQPWMKHFHRRNQDTGQLHFKTERVSRDDLLLLAHDVGEQWRTLGRILLDEEQLEHIDHDQKSLYDKCFTMLTRWTQVKGASATYAALGKALIHIQDLQKEDLCSKYCSAS